MPAVEELLLQMRQHLQQQINENIDNCFHDVLQNFSEIIKKKKKKKSKISIKYSYRKR